MHYVARWRMHVALTWLKEDDAPLGDLASRLGYQSEAAFSQTFKRFIGISPGAALRCCPKAEPTPVALGGRATALLPLRPKPRRTTSPVLRPDSSRPYRHADQEARSKPVSG
jgi:AraC-like DNA-binding protein